MPEQVLWSMASSRACVTAGHLCSSQLRSWQSHRAVTRSSSHTLSCPVCYNSRELEHPQLYLPGLCTQCAAGGEHTLLLGSKFFGVNHVTRLINNLSELRLQEARPGSQWKLNSVRGYIYICFSF